MLNGSLSRHSSVANCCCGMRERRINRSKIIVVRESPTRTVKLDEYLVFKSHRICMIHQGDTQRTRVYCCVNCMKSKKRLRVVIGI